MDAATEAKFKKADHFDDIILEDFVMRCSCRYPSHVVHVSLNKLGTEKHPWHELEFTMSVAPMGGFFKRVWACLKYVFGNKSFTPFDSGPLVEPLEAEKLARICDRFVALKLAEINQRTTNEVPEQTGAQ